VPKSQETIVSGDFFGKGYFVNTVRQHGTKNKISQYVCSKGNESECVGLKDYYQLCFKNASWACSWVIF